MIANTAKPAASAAPSTAAKDPIKQRDLRFTNGDLSGFAANIPKDANSKQQKILDRISYLPTHSDATINGKKEDIKTKLNGMTGEQVKSLLSELEKSPGIPVQELVTKILDFKQSIIGGKEYEVTVADKRIEIKESTAKPEPIIPDGQQPLPAQSPVKQSVQGPVVIPNVIKVPESVSEKKLSQQKAQWQELLDVLAPGLKAVVMDGKICVANPHSSFWGKPQMIELSDGLSQNEINDLRIKFKNNQLQKLIANSMNTEALKNKDADMNISQDEVTKFLKHAAKFGDMVGKSTDEAAKLYNEDGVTFDNISQAEVTDIEAKANAMSKVYINATGEPKARLQSVIRNTYAAGVPDNQVDGAAIGKWADMGVSMADHYKSEKSATDPYSDSSFWKRYAYSGRLVRDFGGSEKAMKAFGIKPEQVPENIQGSTSSEIIASYIKKEAVAAKLEDGNKATESTKLPELKPRDAASDTTVLFNIDGKEIGTKQFESYISNLSGIKLADGTLGALKDKKIMKQLIVSYLISDELRQNFGITNEEIMSAAAQFEPFENKIPSSDDIFQKYDSLIMSVAVSKITSEQINTVTSQELVQFKAAAATQVQGKTDEQIKKSIIILKARQGIMVSITYRSGDADIDDIIKQMKNPRTEQGQGQGNKAGGAVKVKVKLGGKDVELTPGVDNLTLIDAKKPISVFEEKKGSKPTAWINKTIKPEDTIIFENKTSQNGEIFIKINGVKTRVKESNLKNK